MSLVFSYERAIKEDDFQFFNKFINDNDISKKVLLDIYFTLESYINTLENKEENLIWDLNIIENFSITKPISKNNVISFGVLDELEKLDFRIINSYENSRRMKYNTEIFTTIGLRFQLKYASEIILQILDYINTIKAG
jgi:hypothetical protein